MQIIRSLGGHVEVVTWRLLVTWKLSFQVVFFQTLGRVRLPSDIQVGVYWSWAPIDEKDVTPLFSVKPPNTAKQDNWG